MASGVQKILDEAPELSDYAVHCRSIGNAENTIQKQLQSLLMLRRACGNKRVNELSLDDVKHGLAKLKGENGKRAGSLAPETYRHRVAHAKKYYTSIDSPIAEALVIPHITQPHEPEVLDEEQVSKLIQKAEPLRNRIALWILWETGCRPGELLNIKLKDIHMEDKFARITLSGKTGSRTGFVILGYPDLLRYLNDHPQKNEGNSQLIYSQRADKFTNSGLHRLVKLLARDVLGKEISAKTFRHSRYTYLSGKLPDRILMLAGGWRSPKMLQVYSHLKAKDAEDALLRMAGLSKPEEEMPTLSIRRCPQCGTTNSPVAVYCNKCGKPIIELQAQARIEVLQNRLSKLEGRFEVLLKEKA